MKTLEQRSTHILQISEAQGGTSLCVRQQSWPVWTFNHQQQRHTDKHNSFTSSVVHVDSAADKLGFEARSAASAASATRTLPERTLLAIPVPEPVVVVPLPAVPYCDPMHRTKSATTCHQGASALPNA